MKASLTRMGSDPALLRCTVKGFSTLEGSINQTNTQCLKKKKRQITGTIYLHHNASGIGLFTLQGFLLSNKEILICLFAAGALCAHSETDGVVSEAPARLEGQTSVQL